MAPSRNRYKPHYEGANWFGWFESNKTRNLREARNRENARIFTAWRLNYIRRQCGLIVIWVVIGIALHFYLSHFALDTAWTLICVIGLICQRIRSNPPNPILDVSPPDSRKLARNIAGSGFLAGMASGAYFGAGVGLVGGPFGAMAGTIPGAIVGGFIGLFGGHKVGCLLEGDPPDADLETLKKKKEAAQIGGWTGLLAGMGSGAWIGAGWGLAAGPLGAVTGTIPGAIVGGIAGYLGGETIGSKVKDF